MKIPEVVKGITKVSDNKLSWKLKGILASTVNDIVEDQSNTLRKEIFQFVDFFLSKMTVKDKNFRVKKIHFPPFAPNF